ncbi:unnamed protein product [Caenorhabditis angaria]|uniref:C-type lectin domain-containing protein n=1 Tax=Caenorhabditis angaria TaxID=860376 RepID=A0A9P1I7D7_9PELO|nr:unnamed protein product [Caenorhabditis angaria]
MTNIGKLLLLLVFVNFSTQQIRDGSFHSFCDRMNGSETVSNIETDDSGNSVTIPSGDKCRVILNLPAEKKEDALHHCKRWAIFALVDWDAVENKASCTFENVYECKNNFVQIRGMCYRQLAGLYDYREAGKACKKLNAEILRMPSKNIGELMEANMVDLSMYFLQPEEHLKESSQFVEIDHAKTKKRNYVILFQFGIHYDVGPNSIIELDSNKKSYVMCMYKPPETILSFNVKAQQLGVLYHPTQLVGAMAVWRTASHYTPRNIKGYPYTNDDICESSMKAILGTADGTFLNLKPHNIQMLSKEVKSSFVRAFGPFVYCKNEKSGRWRVFYTNKYVTGKICEELANLLEPEYAAKWNVDSKPDGWSFIYYPTPVNGLNFESFRFALHSPILCGLHYEKDVHRALDNCPRHWNLYVRKNNKNVCHRYFHLKDVTGKFMIFDDAKKWCKTEHNATLTRWEDEDEYNRVYAIRSEKGCPDACDAWVQCMTSKGCDKEEHTRAKDVRRGTMEDMRGDLKKRGIGYFRKSYAQSVMCEKPAGE